MSRYADRRKRAASSDSSESEPEYLKRHKKGDHKEDHSKTRSSETKTFVRQDEKTAVRKEEHNEAVPPGGSASRSTLDGIKDPNGASSHDTRLGDNQQSQRIILTLECRPPFILAPGQMPEDKDPRLKKFLDQQKQVEEWLMQRNYALRQPPEEQIPPEELPGYLPGPNGELQQLGAAPVVAALEGEQAGPVSAPGASGQPSAASSQLGLRQAPNLAGLHGLASGVDPSTGQPLPGPGEEQEGDPAAKSQEGPEPQEVRLRLQETGTLVPTANQAATQQDDPSRPPEQERSLAQTETAELPVLGFVQADVQRQWLARAQEVLLRDFV